MPTLCEAVPKNAATRSSTNYTKVPNKLFDDLLMRMNPYQAKIAMWILRQTYGWKREWTPAIGYRGFGEAVGMDKMSIMKHIQSGIRKGFFERIVAGGVYQYRLRFSTTSAPEKKQPQEKTMPAQNEKEINESASQPYEGIIQDREKQPYEEIIQNCMTTSYKTVLRSHTISLGAKEKKEKNKKTITAADTRRTLLQSASSSSYFSHLEKTSESESSFCLSEMETKRKVLASLPFKEDQVETLIRKFDLETLKQAVEWEKTAHYDNLGAAFYSACKNLWKPKKSKEERFKDDKEWVQRNLGELDGKVLKRYRIDLLSKSIELIPAGGGNCQPTVLNYGEKGFREKLKSHLGIP